MTTPKRISTVFLGVALILVLAFVVYLSRNRPTKPIVDRRQELRTLVAEQEAASAQAAAKYQPTTTSPIDDLSSSAVEILRGLPGVVQVDASVRVEKPTSRIIHLLDWHFVPKELFIIDMNHAHGRSLSPDEIAVLYEQHLLEVELVQLEHIAVLRCLLKHHRLKTVFAEGFSRGELNEYRDRIAVLREMEKDQIPTIRNQLKDVRKLAEGATGEKKDKAKAIEDDLLKLLNEHHDRLLEMGASGRLLIAGELDNVLPLEDAAALAQAKPITDDGKVQLDPQKVEARHDAQVRAAMREGPVAAIILGGSHDLTQSIQRLGKGHTEYLRVTTKRFKEIAE